MKKYIALGVTVFLVSLLVYLPSGAAAKYLPAGVTANQYHGNIWQGSAVGLNVNNIQLGTVHWEIRPACFLTFRLCADIVQAHDNLNSQFTLKVSNSIEMDNVFAEGNAMILNALLQRYGITSTGEFKADLDKVSFNASHVEAIEGQINFTPLVINGVVRVHMGNVNSRFETFDDHTRIMINNNNGHLDLNGAIKVFENLTYHADMKLKQNERSSEMISNGLKYVGNIQSDGSVHVEQKGRLTI
ncbi:MAG: type II secretion system protein N [Pseudomonadota bacterium]